MPASSLKTDRKKLDQMTSTDVLSRVPAAAIRSFMTDAFCACGLPAADAAVTAGAMLDADLSAQRLDPFGSTSRPMRWNLINEHNREVQVSIGYAWLELGRRGDAGSETCTLGAGLRAKRGRHRPICAGPPQPS